MMKATIWRLLQRVSGWCKLIQKKNLSTFGVSGESHRGRIPYPAEKRSDDITFGKMGGNAEDRTFRPMHRIDVYWA